MSKRLERKTTSPKNINPIFDEIKAENKEKPLELNTMKIDSRTHKKLTAIKSLSKEKGTYLYTLIDEMVDHWAETQLTDKEKIVYAALTDDVEK